MVRRTAATSAKASATKAVVIAKVALRAAAVARAAAFRHRRLEMVRSGSLAITLLTSS